MIECSEINQTLSYLATTFQDCTQLKASDMQLLVATMTAIYNCDTGPNYNTSIDNLFEPDEDTPIIYPINNFHAISVTVLAGQIEYAGATLPTGSYISKEFSTLNQTEFEIIIKADARVLIERIVEDDQNT